MKDFKLGREEVNFAFQKSGCNDYINNMTEREDRIQGVERKKSWAAIITQTRGDSGLDCSGIREKWIDSISINPQGFPWWHSSKEPICQCRRPGFNPWIRKIPRRRKWEPTPEFLLGKSHNREVCRAAVHGVTKSWTQLSDWTTSKITRSWQRATHGTFEKEKNQRWSWDFWRGQLGEWWYYTVRKTQDRRREGAWFTLEHVVYDTTMWCLSSWQVCAGDTNAYSINNNVLMTRLPW